MSNDVLGTVVTNGQRPSLEKHLFSVARESVLGLSVVDYSEVEAMLGGYLDGQDSPASVAVVISDAPGKRNASYLVDSIDYVEGGNIGLPLRSEHRLKLLSQLVDRIFSLSEVSVVNLAIMDCGQIEEERSVDLAEFLQVLSRDVETYHGPPDTIYRIRRGNPTPP